jgi:hypothetical protein
MQPPQRLVKTTLLPARDIGFAAAVRAGRLTPAGYWRGFQNKENTR